MRLLGLALAVCGLLAAQSIKASREQVIHQTPDNPFERFADGRPKVPDALLEKVKGLSIEEAWGILQSKGYRSQYAGAGFKVLHPGQKLVGRALTAQYLPARPDLLKVLDADAKAAGMPSSINQKVIDLLQVNDVPVVDMGGTGPGHNFGGDNLQAAIYGATKTGAVIDGTVRDIEGLYELPTQVIFREGHPAAVAGVLITGINVPVRIGDAVVMPGDIVLGDRTGLVFIPPQLVEEIVKQAELTHIHDEWTKAKFLTGKYKSSELYPSPSSPELKQEYADYVKKRLAEKK
ncbi:MAG: dimethylmenaquinone methyltransferase [Bryobacteraceae bacterium]